MKTVARILLGSALLVAAPAIQADVIVTTDGLHLEGEAEPAGNGAWTLTTADGRTRLPADRILSVTEGEGPRAAFERRRAELKPDDAPAWVRFALEAEAAGLVDVAADAYRHVLTLDADHAVARRALGYETLEGEWVERDVALVRVGERGLQLLFLADGPEVVLHPVHDQTRALLGRGAAGQADREQRGESQQRERQAASARRHAPNGSRRHAHARGRREGCPRPRRPRPGWRPARCGRGSRPVWR